MRRILETKLVWLLDHVVQHGIHIDQIELERVVVFVELGDFAGQERVEGSRGVGARLFLVGASKVGHTVQGRRIDDDEAIAAKDLAYIFLKMDSDFPHDKPHPHVYSIFTSC